MTPIPNPPRDYQLLTRIGLGLVVGAIVVVAVLTGGGPKQSGTPASAVPTSQSDAAIKAAMTENLTDVSGVQQPPDIAVRDGVLFVVSDLTTDAGGLCRSVMARTHSPDTALPLGVHGVIIIAGGQTLADCRP